MSKIQVDPTRFTGKTFTSRKTFSYSQFDYSIKIDGLTAGRIMKMKGGFQREFWLWTMTGPAYPRHQQNGEAETFEAAAEAFKKLFWEWHAWALKQPGKVTWYGAKK